MADIVLSHWCDERIARARNLLQIVEVGHEYYCDDRKVTAELKAQALQDIERLTAISKLLKSS
jgi:hypothetical protein